MVKELLTLYPIWLHGEDIENFGHASHCRPRRHNIVFHRGFGHFLFGRSAHVEVQEVILHHLVATSNMMRVDAPDTAFLVENKNTFRRKATINDQQKQQRSSFLLPPSCVKKMQIIETLIGDSSLSIEIP